MDRMHFTAAMPLLAISTWNAPRVRREETWWSYLACTKRTAPRYWSQGREPRPRYLLDDPVAAEAGHELCRRGHGEVPLQIHLLVFTSLLHQVEAGHARPEEHRGFISATTWFTD